MKDEASQCSIPYSNPHAKDNPSAKIIVTMEALAGNQSPTHTRPKMCSNTETSLQLPHRAKNYSKKSPKGKEGEK